MVDATYKTAAQVQTLLNKPPSYDKRVRLLRTLLGLFLFTIQTPLIAIDTILGTTHYGRPSWSFKFRILRLLAWYFAWSQNPGTRPRKDVLSDAGRNSIGKLKAEQRAEFVQIAPRPDKLFGDALHEDIQPESVPCFWQWLADMPSPVTDPTPVSQRKAMLYFVGGGMVQGHPLETPLAWRIMEVSKIPVFGVNFRKAVTVKIAFPAALQDAVAAFFYLLELGFRPENVSIMGDSGGGGIVVTTVLYLLRQKLPVPDYVVLVSPWVDLQDEFGARPDLLKLDIVNQEMLSTASYVYTSNRPDLKASLLSPSRNELPSGYSFKDFPKTLLTYGDAEVFAPSVVQLAKALGDEGVDVELVTGTDHVHVYPYYTRERDEGSFYWTLERDLNNGLH